MRETTIAVVTALSPSPTTLAEYGLHLLAALGRKRGIRVVALVEDLQVYYPSIKGVEIHRTWRFGSIGNPWRIARAVRAAGADAVIINAHFTSFGSSKVSAALGLLTPLLLRVLRVPVITLMHNIVETVDLGAAGFRAGRIAEILLRAIGTALTWMVLRSHVVTTTMPRYVDVLREKYRAGNVALTPHGSFGGAPVVPSPPVASRGATVLTFGKFGTYKRVEVLIDAVRSLGRPDVQVVIAGTDSPNSPGYLASMEERYGGSDLQFRGYVPEDEVEALFRSASVTVFPYAGTTGSSGVLHQAGAFGCPPIMPRIGDLQDLVAEEGFTGAYFEPDDAADLARAIAELLDDAEARAHIARVNHVAATGLSLDEIADWYLIHVGTLVHRDPLALLARQNDQDFMKFCKISS
ncbi:glycosyltransferase [Microbacterium sp. NPDC077184]|uniref:glycosyltransferase n=1 Tax=Microbacterium sp. NPDC077184 TaxID=3154764 RepID=UPI00344A340C